MEDNRTYPSEFVAWVAKYAYLDIRGKYRVLGRRLSDKDPSSLVELYDLYLKEYKK